MPNESKGWFSRLGKSFSTSERSVGRAVGNQQTGVQWTSVTLYEGYGKSYSDIYETQPNVRTVVDFIARNIAQLNIKAYKRVGDTDRKQLSDHPAAKLLQRPNPYTTRYRMMRDTVSDMAIYDNAYWVKVRTTSGDMALVRVPPKFVTIRGTSLLRPDSYTISNWQGSESETTLLAEDVIHFRGYSPEDARSGVPPLETLRRTLAQEEAAGLHMEEYWKKAARREGYIQRPIEAPEWSDEAARRFREDFSNQYAGRRNAGRPIVLEDGMEWNESSFSPKDSEWAEGRRLSMEIVARAYHIPLPMVGLMGSSNWGMDQYHEMLYTETLAPWLSMIQEELELQLLSEFPNSDGVYFEFNLQDKLKGSFEAQASILTTSTGGPWLTVNEARARQDLPPIEGGDELITPLNVTRGGGEQAAPTLPTEVPEADPLKSSEFKTKAVTPLTDDSRDEYASEHEERLKAFFTRQRDVILSRKGEWDEDRWNKELTEDLAALAMATVTTSGRKAAEAFKGKFNAALAEDWVIETSRVRAENINSATKDGVEDPDVETKDVFDRAIEVRAAIAAKTITTQLVNFASHEAAHQNDVKTKTWVVTNPKSRHPEMNGETVNVDQLFSNGARWPGDTAALGVDETARCQCLLAYE